VQDSFIAGRQNINRHTSKRFAETQATYFISSFALTSALASNNSLQISIFAWAGDSLEFQIRGGNGLMEQKIRNSIVSTFQMHAQRE
jgi:hypothetical protein